MTTNFVHQKTLSKISCLFLDCLIDFDITADHAAVILADRKIKCVISMTNPSSLIPYKLPHYVASLQISKAMTPLGTFTLLLLLALSLTGKLFSSGRTLRK